jgi:FkbM family methyltransferase
MSDLFPSEAVNALIPRADAYRYSFCTLVSKPSLYRQMLASFQAVGFTSADCEFMYLDNTTSNQGDGYRGLNHMIAQARGTYVILCHQDLIAIDPRAQLDTCLDELTALAPDWGVVGNAGYDAQGKKRFRITDRARYNDHIGDLPGPVVSLDENFLLIRRDAVLGFSHDLAGFHMYGPDLVTQAGLRGRGAWVVNYHIEHLGVGKVDASFLESSTAFEDKYRRVFADRDIRTRKTLVSVGKQSRDVRRSSRKLQRHISRQQRILDVSNRSLFLRSVSRYVKKVRNTVREWYRGPYNVLDGTTFTLPLLSPSNVRQLMRAGTYEAPERHMIAKWLPRNLPVVELGGSYGIISYNIRKQIASEQRLVIVEANPALLPVCRANVDLAGNAAGTTLIGAAIAYGDGGTVRFAVSEAVHDSHLAADHDSDNVVEVPAITLSSLLECEAITSSYSLVCDIEGAEFDLLLHDQSALARCVCMIVEFHSAAFMERGAPVSAFLNMVNQAGFTIVERDAQVIVAVPRLTDDIKTLDKGGE